ncbi:MAG: undecaprenyldiphospho-muramoylpentapeptide beta-N-acetylglucosaminyltransferase [Alphaproteobacteria bacterium]|nr:undecaprenyldiphospho-muramoylpentapeptide beta-N-acetylglucosaminyltransferase [Alphaproteobacteria bacterium]TAD91660.1 MAG: undecaprenyldiphospho-muramoylpentapeptide beta-N-acetylglucosaminyltransferase [Alphaproteobacteria bacterium]
MPAAPHIVLAAGGTGGHLFPAEALAADLIQRGCRVSVFTDTRGLSIAERIPQATVCRVLSATPSTSALWRRLLAYGQLGAGMMQAQWLLLRHRPTAVVGFGGYPSVPTLAAAATARVPIILHEQNAVLGRANALMSSRARSIAVSFPNTSGLRVEDRAKVTLTGNPVRPAIRKLAEQPYPAPEAGGALRLVVTGGSQGARVLAEVVPTALTSLPTEMRQRLIVTQQVRPENLDEVARAYREAGVTADIAPFFNDLPDRLGRCHLAIGRAGASTVMEFAVAGIPAILVPLPTALDDHQTINASHAVEAGGAVLMPQANLTPPYLARRLFSLLRDADQLAAMSAAQRSWTRRDAASALADLVLAAPSLREEAA